MDLPEDLHGASFGTSDEQGFSPAPNPSPARRSVPQAPIPDPTSIVRGNTQGYSQYRNSPLDGSSAQPASLWIPPRFRDNASLPRHLDSPLDGSSAQSASLWVPPRFRDNVPPAQYLDSPLDGSSAQPASPWVPPRFRGDVPLPLPYLPSTIASDMNPPPTAPMQYSDPKYHHHRLPIRRASGLFIPPTENAVQPAPSITSLGPSIPPLSIVPALLSPQSDLPSLGALAVKKRRLSDDDDDSAVQKRSRGSEARPAHLRQPEQYEENDVRAKAPENWDEVKVIQRVLESAVRSYARVMASAPPEVSPWGSYREQRDAFQAALDSGWHLDERPGSPPELAGIGPWYGPITSIIDAPVVIAEDDLEFATHPIIASYEPEPGSMASMERIHDFGYLLQNQFQPSDQAQPTGPVHHGIRSSAAQPMSLRVDHQRIHEGTIAPYQLGALVAEEKERNEQTDDSLT